MLTRAFLAAAVLATAAAGEDILVTSGFSTCNQNSSVTVQRANIKYNNDNKTVTFDVAGTSTRVQNVTAMLNVTAYGQQVYSNSFDPCSPGTFVEQLCPVPAGTFAAKGVQEIPKQYADLVPAIAFQVPDIAAMATLQLMAKDGGERVACVQSTVTNGKTAAVPAVSYVAAGVAGVALVAAGVSAVGAAVAGGSAAAAGSAASGGGFGTISPSFTEVFGWFQGMAMNGMLSVAYPQVYRSFAKNFGFSTGLVPWTSLQTSIDGFRNMTGGNLTVDSVQVLHNATLVFDDASSNDVGGSNSSTVKIRRAFDTFLHLSRRQIEIGVNGTGADSADGATSNPESTTQSIRLAVHGIQAYVNELSIPSANTFMTVLLIVAIIIAALTVGILLIKVILEFWALFGSFPKSLSGFRKHYWGSIARAITSLILVLYGIWVLYCIFQFTHGDSWAAKTLAGVTLFLFTGVLAFFSFKIWWTARKLRLEEGDASGLYKDKDIWVKYSLFYESYRKDYWWIFVPTIVYMFAKGCTIAAMDGHGMTQTIAQLVIEAVMLILLLWSRPYERKSGNVINIIIQTVRVLSVVCILVFVEEFGIAQTTQTVTGVVLIAVQSALTGILAILIVWNAILACVKENPHRKRRKEMEQAKLRDTLTPLDARNSLLRDHKPSESTSSTDTFSIGKTGDSFVTEKATQDPERYAGNTKPTPAPGLAVNNGPSFRALTPVSSLPTDTLIANAAPIGSSDPLGGRQPTLPDLGMRQPTVPNAGMRQPTVPNVTRPGAMQPTTGYRQGPYGPPQQAAGYGQGPYGRPAPGAGYGGYGGYRGPSRGGY
ncbi:hypothetical protein DL546_005904 [Coniochaeta pulveracea]|uniref:ML-like domain-containing protein n=1 Tax=Coniochaeta pulveracea TaxID=177199 RepID=A0A420YE30_9PEZI|nr:hypothetical protein DL546_005904 [Coniochaeta pulveracea]